MISDALSSKPEPQSLVAKAPTFPPGPPPPPAPSLTDSLCVRACVGLPAYTSGGEQWLSFPQVPSLRPADPSLRFPTSASLMKANFFVTHFFELS
jgi:hypothetical protein